MKIISGGVTAPSGFKASGVHCGIKKNGKPDLAIVVSDKLAVASGVFTTNVVKGHSLQLAMKNIKASDGIKAIVVNSGNANACVGEAGDAAALEITELTGKYIGCHPTEVLLNSTGVVGQPLNMDAVRGGLKAASEILSYKGGDLAAKAIMTTDTIQKEVTVQVEVGGKTVTIGGMAKGSGMIHPNMATMIGVITTDVAISKDLLDTTLRSISNQTFNRISVDGDTSVCDMVVLLANGSAGNSEITSQGSDYDAFCEGLKYVCEELSKMIIVDGEGATKFVEITVNNAPTADDAYKIAVSVAKSPLVKTALFGEDANWGRILTAAGYSGASFDPTKVDIFLGEVLTCKSGTAVAFDEAKAKEILAKKEVKILIDLKQGTYQDRMWTCDFSYDYVKINGSYRT